MKNLKYILLFSCFISFGLQAQSKKAVKLLNKAREEVRSDNINGAISYLDKALEDSPKYVDALLFKADLLTRMGNPEQTLDLYERAINAGAQYYVYLFYGQALFDAGEYTRAVEVLEQYTQNPRAKGKYLARAEKLIENSQFAVEAIENAQPYNPQNMGSKVNSRAMEYFPSISADGLTLVFTHRDPDAQKSDEDFWVSQRDSVEAPWQKAEPLKGMLNTILNEGAQSLSAGGSVIFFTACERPEGLGSCDIYASVYQGNNSFSKPFNLGPNINSPIWESQPSISSDGKTLYFVRGAGSTARDIDIMYSTLGDDGKWTKAQKLGGKINTPGQDVSPFIHFDNQSLYFASNGHPGMGDLDFFVSRRQEDGSWGEPQNLGYPINTAGQEFSLIVAPDGKTGYFASDNMEGGFGLLDLYSFELPEEARAAQIAYVKGRVINQKTRQPVQAEIIFSDIDKNLQVLQEQSNQNGQYFSVLPANTDYALSIQKKGFLFYSKNFALSNESAERAYILNVELIPIEVGKTVELENIFFATDSYELKERSFAELNTVVHFMRENPEVEISVEGHTDDVGSTQYNLKLSRDRARSVYDYLLENGIAKERLSFKGFGNSKPVASNDTEEGRSKNRRTEIKITSFSGS